MLRTSISPAFCAAGSALFCAPYLRASTSAVPKLISHPRPSPTYCLTSRLFGTTYPRKHTYSNDGSRSVTVHDKPQPKSRTWIQGSWIMTKEGLWLNIKTRTDFLVQNQGLVDCCIAGCTTDLFKYFGERSMSDISQSLVKDGSRLEYELEPGMINSLRRFEFASNPLLSISIELPCSIRSRKATVMTKNGTTVSATFELVYQQPSDISKASLAETEINQLLEAHVNKWKEQISEYTYENLCALVDIDTPHVCVEQPRLPQVLILKRHRIDSVTKSQHELFAEEFNKQYPRSLPIEIAVGVLGGLPIMLARLLLRRGAIKSLAAEHTIITVQTHNQYQATMRCGTWSVGLIAALIAFVGAKIYEEYVWSREAKDPCVVTTAALLFGIPYAWFIRMITKNEAQHRHHKCNYRLC